MSIRWESGNIFLCEKFVAISYLDGAHLYSQLAFFTHSPYTISDPPRALRPSPPQPPQLVLARLCRLCHHTRRHTTPLTLRLGLIYPEFRVHGKIRCLCECNGR